MKRVYLAIFFFLAGFCSIQAQNTFQAGEHLVPLRANPIQQNTVGANSTNRSAMVLDTIPFPTTGIIEHFNYNSHTPDDSIWDMNFAPVLGAYVNQTWAKSPINIGVCTFDGLMQDGMPYDSMASVNSTQACDYLTSKPIDLSGNALSDSVYLSFWYQPQGFGYAPNAQDSFIVEYNIPAWNPNAQTIVWKQIWYTEGYTPALADSGFHIAMLKLDSASYFVNGFRFRFRNYASGCGSNDHWHLDEVYMKKGRTMNDTLVQSANFVYQMPSFLKNYRAMPYDHYKPSEDMIGNVNIQIRNNDTTGRNITYQYEVKTSSGAPLFNYNAAGPPALPPFSQSGYCSDQPKSYPDVYPNQFINGFPQNALDTSSYIVRHKLIDGSRIDSVDYTQRFYNFYAYDDGSAEVGYGLYGTYSSLAYKFKNEGDNPDTLLAIQMYFLPVQDIDGIRLREFNLVVWSDNGNGPGQVIYRERNQHTDYNFQTVNRFITYELDSGIVQIQPGQTYYIGWEQIAADRMYIGFDYNDDNHDKIYFNTTGNWLTSIFNGSLMMRPVFGGLYDATGVAEIPADENGISVYPNPANEQVTIVVQNQNEAVNVNLMDMSGRVVQTAAGIYSGTSIDTTNLSAGVYFVQVMNLNGAMIGTKRLVIQ
jgi:hypothetical protein